MDADLLPTLPSSVKHEHKQDVDIISWSYPKNGIGFGNFCVRLVALLMFGSATLSITFQILSGALIGKNLIEIIFIIVFALFMWLVVVGIFASLFSLTTWHEAIHISDDKIVLDYSGKGAPKTKRFNKKNLMGLAFKDGRYPDPDEDEALPALSIFYARRYKGGIEEREVNFAIWVKPEDKHQLFLFLQTIIKEKGWHITYRLNDRPSW